MSGAKLYLCWVALSGLLFACADGRGTEVVDAGGEAETSDAGLVSQMPDAAPAEDAAASAADGSTPDPVPHDASVIHDADHALQLGATEFVSADLTRQVQPQTPLFRYDDEAEPPFGVSTPAPHHVRSPYERGDLYRVLSDDRILMANYHHGLDIIDVSDAARPRLEGTLRLPGSAFAVHVVNERAVVLVNDWHHYDMVADRATPSSTPSALVLWVDIHDRGQPKVLSQLSVRGVFTQSALRPTATGSVMHVIANDGGAYYRALSFTVVDDVITASSEVALGDTSPFVLFTEYGLFVAHNAYLGAAPPQSTVLVLAADPADGRLQLQTRMLLGGRALIANDILSVYGHYLTAVVSLDEERLQLETYDVSDLANIAKVATCSQEAPSAQLSQAAYASADFVDNRVYVSQRLVPGPIRMWTLDERGQCGPLPSFGPSDWTDVARVTANATKFLSVGRPTDGDAYKPVVRLYDTSSPAAAAAPLGSITFDLLTNAADPHWLFDAAQVIEADDSTLQLMVVPGYSDYDVRLQTFDFSNGALVRTAQLTHGHAFDRAFHWHGSTIVTLSNDRLALFDMTDPQMPVAVGSLTSASSYEQLIRYGDYYAGVATDGVSRRQLEIAHHAADLRPAGPIVATLDLPLRAALYPVGHFLVSVSWDAWMKGQPELQTSTIQVFDLRDPTQPKAAGTLHTDRLLPIDTQAYPPRTTALVQCSNCERSGSSVLPEFEHVTLDHTLVFPRRTAQSETRAPITRCTTTAEESRCAPNASCPGYIDCYEPRTPVQWCTGSYYSCDDTRCVPTVFTVGADAERCDTFDERRDWQALALDALDLSNPDQPILAPRVTMPQSEESLSVFGVGDKVYANYRSPLRQPGEPRQFAKHFLRTIDFSDPLQPQLSAAVNIPGVAFAARGDDLYTQHEHWIAESASETVITRLHWTSLANATSAVLEAARPLPGRTVFGLTKDGAGHIVVSSRGADEFAPRPAGLEGYTPNAWFRNEITLLDEQDLTPVGPTHAVDGFIRMLGAAHGYVLYQAQGGLLRVDTKVPAASGAHAFLPLVSVPGQALLEADAILVPPYASEPYRFDVTEHSLP